MFCVVSLLWRVWWSVGAHVEMRVHVPPSNPLLYYKCDAAMLLSKAVYVNNCLNPNHRNLQTQLELPVYVRIIRNVFHNNARTWHGLHAQNSRRSTIYHNQMNKPVLDVF